MHPNHRLATIAVGSCGPTHSDWQATTYKHLDQSTKFTLTVPHSYCTCKQLFTVACMNSKCIVKLDTAKAFTC